MEEQAQAPQQGGGGDIEQIIQVVGQGLQVLVEGISGNETAPPEAAQLLQQAFEAYSQAISILHGGEVPQGEPQQVPNQQVV